MIAATYRPGRPPRLRIALLIGLLIALPGSAAAQRIVGRVTDASTGSPIPGAIVRLAGADGEPVTRLSVEGGIFRFDGRFAAPLVVTVEMMGFERWTSVSLPPAAADSIFVDARLQIRPLPLEDVRAESTSRCRARGALSPVTQELWRDVKTALTAERVSREAGDVRYWQETYEREVAPDGLVVRDRRTRRTNRNPVPFSNVSEERLRERGFFEEGADGAFLHGPTSDVLLAAWFVQTHCLALAPRAERTGRIGLRFAPNDERVVPDIRGTMWLYEDTRDLESIEYVYVALPAHLPAGDRLGTVRYERLRSGSLVIVDWSIDGPVVQLVEEVVAGRTRRVERSGGRYTTGGAILTGTLDGDTLYRSDRARLTGTVTDHVAGGPLAGARVLLEGTMFETRTDSAGRYAFDMLPAGTYHVRFEHDILAEYAYAPPPVRITIEPHEPATLDLAIPGSVRSRPR